MKYLKLYEDFTDLDSEVKNFCEKYNIDYSTITIENGVVNVEGSVILVSKQLKSLPFKFGKVSGNFYINGNKSTK